jgi:hypothetical protein
MEQQVATALAVDDQAGQELLRVLLSPHILKTFGAVLVGKVDSVHRVQRGHDSKFQRKA